MAEAALAQPAGRSTAGRLPEKFEGVITMFTIKFGMAMRFSTTSCLADAELTIVSSQPASAKRIEKALGA